jgi:hypothetical protein
LAAFAIQATTECTDLDAGAAVCDGGEDSGGCFLESENNETVTDAEKQSDQEGVALEGTGLSNPELVIAWLTGLGITVANTRVAKYKKILAVSTAFTAQGKLKELDRLYPIQERANAFHESGELSLIRSLLRAALRMEVLQLWRGDLISWTNAPRTLSRRSVQMAPI